MELLKIAIVLLVAIGVCVANDVIEFELEVEEEEVLLDLLSMPILPERYKSEDFKQKWDIATAVTAFKWEDCGGSGVHISSLSISPDPIKLPGKINVSFEVDVDTTVDAPLEGKLKIEKKIMDIWTPIPCIDNVGSCTYKDVCQNLRNVTCSPVLADHGIPCHCPFNTGTYKLPASQFKVPKASGALHGDYRMTVQLYDNNEKMLACLSLQVALK